MHAKHFAQGPPAGPGTGGQQVPHASAGPEPHVGDRPATPPKSPKPSATAKTWHREARSGCWALARKGARPETWSVQTSLAPRGAPSPLPILRQPHAMPSARGAARYVERQRTRGWRRPRPRAASPRPPPWGGKRSREERWRLPCKLRAWTPAWKPRNQTQAPITWSPSEAMLGAVSHSPMWSAPPREATLPWLWRRCRAAGLHGGARAARPRAAPASRTCRARHARHRNCRRQQGHPQHSPGKGRGAPRGVASAQGVSKHGRPPAAR